MTAFHVKRDEQDYEITSDGFYKYTLTCPEPGCRYAMYVYYAAPVSNVRLMHHPQYEKHVAHFDEIDLPTFPEYYGGGK